MVRDRLLFLLYGFLLGVGITLTAVASFVGHTDGSEMFPWKTIDSLVKDPQWTLEEEGVTHSPCDVGDQIIPRLEARFVKVEGDEIWHFFISLPEDLPERFVAIHVSGQTPDYMVSGRTDPEAETFIIEQQGAYSGHGRICNLLYPTSI